MKRHTADDGTRTHGLTVTQKKHIGNAIGAVNEIECFHQGTPAGEAYAHLVLLLRRVHSGEPLPPEQSVGVRDEDAEKS